MYTVNDVIHLLIIGVIHVSGIVLNSLLIVAIIKRTPPVMRTYSILLLNMACSDIIASLSNLMTGSRVITIHETFSQVTIFLGPCSFISNTFCQFTNSTCIDSLNTHTMTHSSALLFCAFIFRIQSLRPSNNQIFSKICTWITCIVVALPTLVALVAFLQQKLFIDSPAWSDPRFTRYTIIVFSMHQEVIVTLAILYTMAVITFSTVLAVIARYILVLKIRGMSSKSSHRTIAQALSFHILLPLFYAIGYVLWIIDSNKVYSSEWLERSFLIVAGFSSPMSACINLYFLIPYRRFLLGLLTRNRIGDTSSSNHARQPAVIPEQQNVVHTLIVETSV